MIDFTVSSNLEDIIANLRDIEAKHVPFAWTLALNRTASAAQSLVRESMGGDFTLRRDWTKKGVRTKNATKGNPVAMVYTLDWYMEQQEQGATRQPRSGQLFIPSLNVREGRSFAGEVEKGMRPRALLRGATKADWKAVKRFDKGGRRAYGGPRMGKDHAQPLAFIAPTANGKGLFIRKGAARTPITLLYTLKDSVTIAPRWGFQGKTQGVADKHLRRQFIEALDHALKTAKGGAVKSDYVSYLRDFDGEANDPFGGGRGGPGLGQSVLSSMTR